MGFAKWSRWGRGAAEGYTLEFGWLIRCDVMPINDGERWNARMNRHDLGEFATIEDAQKRAEQEARHQLSYALEFWTRFDQLPERRKGRGRRSRKPRRR